MRLNAVWLLETLVQPADADLYTSSFDGEETNAWRAWTVQLQSILSSSEWKCIDWTEKQIASTKPHGMNKGVRGICITEQARFNSIKIYSHLFFFQFKMVSSTFKQQLV